MPRMSRILRSFLGIPGVVLVMFIILGIGMISAKNQKISDNVSLSINFKTLRKLEYQAWLSRNSPEDFVESDEVSADIMREGGLEPIFIKSLPADFTSSDGKKLSFRLNFTDTVQAPMYLFAESPKANQLAKINEILSGSLIAQISSDWILVEVNGLSVGKYLRVTWPRIEKPVIVGLSDFLKTNPEIKSFISGDANFSRTEELAVVGTTANNGFEPSHVIFSELGDIYE